MGENKNPQTPKPSLEFRSIPPKVKHHRVEHVFTGNPSMRRDRFVLVRCPSIANTHDGSTWITPETYQSIVESMIGEAIDHFGSTLFDLDITVSPFSVPGKSFVLITAIATMDIPVVK